MTPANIQRASELLRIVSQATSTLTTLRTAKNGMISVGENDEQSGDGQSMDRVVLDRALTKRALEMVRGMATSELEKIGIKVEVKRRRAGAVSA